MEWTSQRRRSNILCFSILLLGSALLTPLGAAPPPLHQPAAGADVPEAILQKIERLAQPEDQPDGAQAYFELQRQVHDGGSRDLTLRHRQAALHKAQMTAYSSRLGKVVTPEAAQKNETLGRWTALGPGNIGGRTRSLVIHPNNPNTLWLGGVSGGIWKSTNGGNNWSPLTDLASNIAINSMAITPGQPDVLYAGTGEGYFREVVRGTSLPLRGGGILKTTNGTNFFRLASTNNPNFHWVNDLAVSHLNPQRLYAATRSGLWRSDNGGNSFQRILNPNVQGGCFRLALRSDRPTDTLFASCGSFERATVYRNPAAEGNGGWQPVLSENGMGLTSLALAPSNQDVIYAMAASHVVGPGANFDGGLHAVFRSDDGGSNWQAVNRNTDPVKLNTLLLSNPVIANLVECGFGNQNNYSNLGWYTNTLAVDPTNPMVVWAGGVDLFRSDNGGADWGPISHWFASPQSAHADQHMVRFHPSYNGGSNQTLFVAGDGGVWRTDNALAAKGSGNFATCDPSATAVSWRSLNRDLGITQFYHGVPYPNGRQYLGGTQDNGTVSGLQSTGVNGWQRILGGDGGYVAVDPERTDTVYAETQLLGFRKSVDGGNTFESAVDGIGETSNSVLFIVPFVMDPNQSSRLWLGGQRLWRTNNGAASWTAASRPMEGGGKVSAIAVAPTNSQRVLVGLSNGFIQRNNQALDADSTSPWPAVRPRDGFVSWLAHDPNDPSVAYATYAGFGGAHVWKSSDGGASWSSIDGSGAGRLPDIPAHSLVVDPTDGQRLYLGTDLGVFVSRDGGGTWMAENTGFANAVTEALAYLPAQGSRPPRLYAFTHGRGAWRVDIEALSERDQLSFSVAELTLGENSGSVSLDVLRSGLAAGAVTVDYRTVEDTASEGLDFTAVSGTLSWPENDVTPRSITIPILDDDIDDPFESFDLLLENATGEADITAPDRVVVSIFDDDDPNAICIPSETVVCLVGGRFKVEVRWRDFAGLTGRGHLVPDGQSDDSALMWFFEPLNWEMLIKVIDGCQFNGHYWVFAAATTNVQYSLQVVDTQNGQLSIHNNPLGRSSPAITDSTAFPLSCP